MAWTGYPNTAAAMHAAVGWGEWDAGWLFDITSGNDTGAFGGVTMVANNSPNYSVAGPRGGSDLAVGFDANTAQFFSAGDNFDVGTTSHLVLAGVNRLPVDLASPSDTINLCAKQSTLGVDTGYRVYAYRTSASDAGFVLQCIKGGDSAFVLTQVAGGVLPVNEWFCWIAVIDRSTQKARLAVKSLSGVVTISSEVSTSAIGDMGNLSNFFIGAGHNKAFHTAALYVGAGTNKGTGLSANLATAINNFSNAIFQELTPPTVTVTSTPSTDEDPLVLQVSDVNGLGFFQVTYQEHTDDRVILVYEHGKGRPDLISYSSTDTGFFHPFSAKSTITGSGTIASPYILTIYKRGRWRTGIENSFKIKAVDSFGNVITSS